MDDRSHSCRSPGFLASDFPPPTLCPKHLWSFLSGVIYQTALTSVGKCATLAACANTAATTGWSGEGAQGTSADEALTFFGNFYKPSSITQKYGDREKTLPSKELEEAAFKWVFDTYISKKNLCDELAKPSADFSSPHSWSSAQEDQLPRYGAGHSVPHYWHTLVTFCLLSVGIR